MERSQFSGQMSGFVSKTRNGRSVLLGGQVTTKLRKSNARETTLANGKGKLWSNGKGKTCHGAARQLPSRQTAKSRHGKLWLNGNWANLLRQMAREKLPSRQRHGKLPWSTTNGQFVEAGQKKVLSQASGKVKLAASQSQHELMTSLVVRHCVSQWQRCIVRTIE